jgi:hypothetical protein
MGTSAVHRSPGTARWRIVNNLYDAPDTPTERLLAEIFNAAEQYSEGLGSPAVVERVSAFLHAVDASEWRADSEAALTAAREAVANAQQAAVHAGLSSFYGDLADRAMHTALVSAGGQPDVLETTAGSLGVFLSNLVGISIDHLVSRDVGAHLGSPRLPSAADALRLRRSLSAQARALAHAPELEPILRETAVRPQENWSRLVGRLWQLGTAVPTPRG